MILLSGTYQCKADTKGRFVIPSGFRKDLASVIDEGFVLKISFFVKDQPCLELHPMSWWNKLVKEAVQTFTSMNPNDRRVLRRFISGGRKVEIDASGRILIPKDLAEVVGIERDVVLTGIGNAIEIWDKDKYEAIMNEDGLDDLANEYLQNIKFFDGIS